MSASLDHTFVPATGPERDRGNIQGLIATSVVVVGLIVVAVLVVGKLWGLPFSTETKDRTPPPILLDLRNLSEYHAAQAQFELTLDQENDVKWLPSFIAGDRVQFVAVGSVDAIVDFRDLGSGAVVVADDGTSVTVTLPRATYAEPVLDLEQSHVMNRDRGIINRVGGLFTDNPTSEHDLLLNAQSRIADAAAETDLLATAEDNTKSMLYTMLRGLGFAQVDIRFE